MMGEETVSWTRYKTRRRRPHGRVSLKDPFGRLYEGPEVASFQSYASYQLGCYQRQQQQGDHVISPT